jgi:predicted Zn-dependent peptidase
VRSYRSDDARRFTARYYRPENAVFFASGDLDFKRLLRWLGATASIAATTIPVASASGSIAPIAPTAPASPVVLHRNTHQVHVMLGTQAYAATDPRRWALYLLNNLLGGPSMNSRLNLALRERNALVYTVDSQMTCYSDTGLWSVYFGCDPADVRRCLRLVHRELDRLMQNQLTPAQLASAKRQVHGQIAIAAENREQAAIDFGRYFLHEGRERHLSELLAHLDALTAHDLQQTAQELFAADRLLTLVYS